MKEIEITYLSFIFNQNTRSWTQ